MRETGYGGEGQDLMGLKKIMLRWWSFILVVFLLGCLVASTVRPLLAASAAPIVIKDIPYPGAAKGDRQRSFDLYRPAKSDGKPPLLIFVHGGFWALSDDKYRIGASLAETLVQDGVAVALVRYRLAPASRHPAQAEDVATAVAHLIQKTGEYGYDAKRVYLAGHSAGGHLAALVALDRKYLGRHKITTDRISGVIALSGIFDLTPAHEIGPQQRQATRQAFDRSFDALKSASPLTYVRADAPKFLILTAARDFPGFALDAREFADAFRRAGKKEIDQLIVAGADHFSIAKFDDDNSLLRQAVLDFMGMKAPPRELADWIEAKRRWAQPPYSTLPFWKYEKLVRSYPVDERFLKMLLLVFRSRPDELLELPLKQYHAIDLFAYLDALPKELVGEGDHIILANVRGERQVWIREQIGRFKPVIVIGLDGEKNLFSLSVFYRMQREYSWKPGGPSPLLTMTLGAFIHFLEQAPRDLLAKSRHFGLTENSFQRTKEDPLKAMRDVPKDVEEALTFRNGCVYCHSFRGTGSRSHHVHALTGKPHGGFALPLESYPPEVWKAFMFDQEAVATKMGATPNIVEETAREALFDLVNRSRQANATGK
jgi:acetyl esterase/lipase